MSHLFATKEEAIAQAETLGCRGYHEHELEGKTVYMACETHDELMGFNLSEKTELDKFIEEYGEDIPDDWEIVDQENADGEHEDFDFEAELNRLANENPDKTIFCLDPVVCPCSTMYRIHPAYLLWMLDGLNSGVTLNQIKVDHQTREEAKIALDRMLTLR